MGLTVAAMVTLVGSQAVKFLAGMGGTVMSVNVGYSSKAEKVLEETYVVTMFRYSGELMPVHSHSCRWYKPSTWSRYQLPLL